MPICLLSITFLFAFPIAIVPFSESSVFASDAHSLALFIDVQVASFKKMTCNAVSLFVILGRRIRTSKGIFAWANRFQVIWIYTIAYLTKMIDLVSLWNISYEESIRNNMGTSALASNAYSSITRALKFGGTPTPTSCCRVCSYVSEKTFSGKNEAVIIVRNLHFGFGIIA